MSHLFGPVPSRRLGRSLGVDLIPRKTCSFNCIYCEVGPTTHLTVKRRAHAVPEIIGELEEYCRRSPGDLDYVTLAGSGEPTLNLGLGEIIAAIKALTAVPVAVLTNGSLLYLPEVRRELARADVILPSLDAGREETFRRLNRPHPRLTLELVVRGIKALRREFQGEVWLEVMLLQGINDSEEELEALKGLIADIAPHRIQLNTLVRPGADPEARPVEPEELERIARWFGPTCEVIAGGSRKAAAAGGVVDRELLEMLARRPMTAGDLARALGVEGSQVETRLVNLAEQGLVEMNLHQDRKFYRALPTAPG
jgi:wyosine [tRNA(Phe)-imidazoG37] synthetase (radical SAM superfamily)